jgi:dipeptidyl aminopeptidase/acylaminoacyl peptidase
MFPIRSSRFVMRFPGRILLGGLLVLAGSAALAPQPAQAQQKHLSLDMYMDWEWVSDPQISPDGTQIIYTRRWVDAVNDRRESSIWIMNADGSRNRFLVDGSSPTWSPSGDRIAFTARGEPNGNQIFVRWMDAEGSTTQITRVENSPGGIEWSPDGTHIGFTMLVDSNERWSVQMPRRPDGAKWTEDPKVVTRATYRRDRQGYVDQGYQHVFVVPAEGGTPRQLTDGMWNHSGNRWTPDGREILFAANRVDEDEYTSRELWRQSDVYAVDVASGAIRQLTTRDGQDGNPVPSPDGSLVAYVGDDKHDDTYKNPHIYVMDRDGGNSRMISGDFDRSPNGLTWASDGSGLYFNVSELGTRNVYFVSRDGGVRQITEGNHLLDFSSMTDDGLMVGTRSNYHEPGDVVSFRASRGVEGESGLAELTRVNDDILTGVALGQVEEIWYKSVDDFDIQGWVITPPDFDPNKKYPMMLAIHGGPHGMYNVGFNFGWQEHAANGYVVLYTNPRGSSGYGSAFGNSIKRAYPGKDFDDLMNGVDQVVGRGFVDEDNMFVYGCSGGGVLTSWIVGHTDRFAAASANCPVTNWLSFVGTTDGITWYNNFDNYPWDDPSEHLRRSPLMYVGNVTTPTMLMTGELDLRTPMPQTEEFYAALKVLKIPTAMVRFKGEWHGTSSIPSNFMRTQLYLRKWFEEHGTHSRPIAEEDR